MPTSQPAPRSTTTRPAPLSQLVGTPPCDAEHVLLGCFGLDLGGTARGTICAPRCAGLATRARSPATSCGPARY